MTIAATFEVLQPWLRQGDAYVTRLALSGWQTAATTLRTWSDEGRMWGTITAANAFELYRRPGLAAGDKVCSGTISGGAVTLAQANSSGITGSADVSSFTTGSVHLFDVVVSYADELDIASLYANVANELDSNSKWEAQGTRFEALLHEQKRYLDNLLWARLDSQVGTDQWGRPALGRLSAPRQYARVHALLCAAAILDARAGVSASDQHRQLAAAWRAMAISEFGSIKPALDSDRDGTVDGFASVSSLRVVRG